MGVQGWVVVGLAVVLFGYLVPHLVASRHRLAQARVEDRFSATLRVVATGATARRSAGADHHPRQKRPYLHDPRRRTEAPAVNRPTTHSERAAAETRRLAHVRAARAAEISRRRAAAKRRLVLTIVLLIAALGGWLGFGLADASIVLGIVPTVLLGAVLVLGRRAAKVAARRNAADRAAMARLKLNPAPATPPARTRTAGGTAATGSTSASAPTAQLTTATPEPAASATPAADVEPAAAATAAADGEPAALATLPADVPADVGAEPSVPAQEDATSAPVDEHADSQDANAEDAGATSSRTVAPADESGGLAQEREWTPVPVPAPAYTLKAPAPRRDVAPYAAPVEEPAAEAATSAAPVVVTSGLAGSPYAPVADPEREETSAPAAPPSRALDLDSALARRRAVGA